MNNKKFIKIINLILIILISSKLILSILVKKQLTSHGFFCTNKCNKTGGTSYYWCLTGVIGDNWWDYCSPRPCETAWEQRCQRSHSCDYHGHNYLWCKTEDNSWGFCGESIYTAVKDYNCISECQIYENGYYYCLVSGGSYEKCSPFSDSTVAGVPCWAGENKDERENNKCTKNKWAYFWCYTSDKGHWDYCKPYEDDLDASSELLEEFGIERMNNSLYHLKYFNGGLRDTSSIPCEKKGRVLSRFEFTEEVLVPIDNFLLHWNARKVISDFRYKFRRNRDFGDVQTSMRQTLIAGILGKNGARLVLQQIYFENHSNHSIKEAAAYYDLEIQMNLYQNESMIIATLQIPKHIAIESPALVSRGLEYSLQVGKGVEIHEYFIKSKPYSRNTSLNL